MAKRKLELKAEEIAAFRAREDETKEKQELRRLQAVRAYGTGVAMQEIASVVDCHEDSVRHWAQQYQAEGLAGLASKWSRQNASKLSPKQRLEIKDRLETYQPDHIIEPDLRMSQGEFWTISDLEIGLKQWYGVVYRDQSSYRRLLHDCGFSYQGTEQVYRSRPKQETLVDFEAELEKK